MALNVDLPDETMRRLEAEAARRHVGIDVVIAELAGTLPPVADERTTEIAERSARKHRLAITGVGASGGRHGRAADADDLLVDGFGRD